MRSNQLIIMRSNQLVLRSAGNFSMVSYKILAHRNYILVAYSVFFLLITLKDEFMNRLVDWNLLTGRVQISCTSD